MHVPEPHRLRRQRDVDRIHRRSGAGSGHAGLRRLEAGGDGRLGVV